MKNPTPFYFLLIALLLFSSHQANAQAEQDSIPSYTKEWNLNAFNLLIFQALDVSFEKYIDDESSYGFSALVSLGGENRFDESAPFYYETVSLSPYYRIYFGRGANVGFYIEAFGSLSFGKHDNYDYDYGPLDDYTYDYRYYDYYRSFTEFGLGFAVGGKFITKKKYTLSVFGGAARNFIGEDGPGAMPRVGITIGRRF